MQQHQREKDSSTHRLPLQTQFREESLTGADSTRRINGPMFHLFLVLQCNILRAA